MTEQEALAVFDGRTPEINSWSQATCKIGKADLVRIWLDADGRVLFKSASIQGHHFMDPSFESTASWWDRCRTPLGW
jgi:hypothetical protein